MIIVIDGPEKSGKSTLIKHIRAEFEANGCQTDVRKWGPVDPDDRVYSTPMQVDVINQNIVTIWDRSWASEHVYARLLGRNRRLREDPWLGEFIHRRAVIGRGMCLMVLPANVDQSRMRRDDTDLRVNPMEEKILFEAYADRFRWAKWYNWFNGEEASHSMAVSVVRHLLGRGELRGGLSTRSLLSTSPHEMVGPYPRWGKQKVLVVGDRGSITGKGGPPGAWMPWSSRYTMKFARDVFGDAALGLAWTNASTCDPKVPFDAEYIVAAGDKAYRFVTEECGKLFLDFHKIVCVPHPAWLYRWNVTGMGEVLVNMQNEVKEVAIVAREQWNAAEHV